MSKQKPIIIFPILNNAITYTFPHMGEFEIIDLIAEGAFSEVFKARPKETNNAGSSKIFNYIIKICKKMILSEDNENQNPPKTILFYEINEVHLLQKIKNIGNPNLIRMYDWSIDRKTCELKLLLEHMPYDLRKYFSNEENYKKLDENL